MARGDLQAPLCQFADCPPAPGRVVHPYYVLLCLHSLDLLYLKVRFVGHNVIDAIIHVDAIFHSDKLELLCLLVFEDNGECHFAFSIMSCSS